MRQQKQRLREQNQVTRKPPRKTRKKKTTWGTMASAAKKALTVLTRLSPERPSPELLETSRMEEVHKDVDRTKGRI